jgi:hypothetical protein
MRFAEVRSELFGRVTDTPEGTGIMTAELAGIRVACGNYAARRSAR